jgi:hypothetical protein
LPAWALYRELTSSNRAAGFATLLLFMQPELLFVVLRGSHERVTRFLMFVVLWLLIRSFRHRDRPGQMAIHVILYHLAAYGMIAMNALFGLSFVLAIGIAMATAWAISRFRPRLWALAGPVAGHLALASLSITLIGYLYIFAIYPSAGAGLDLLSSIGKKLYAVSTTTEAASATSYRQVVSAWVSLRVYFLLSIGTYLLMAGSAVIWLVRTLRWLFWGKAPPTFGQTISWLLYTAFAIQGALAILGDISGYSVSNLQVRAYPSFAMLATPVVATALAQWRPRWWLAAPAAALMMVLVPLAVLKATNEPALSNKWTFYAPLEIRAMRWADAYHHDAQIWVGRDERLTTGYGIEVGAATSGNRFIDYSPRAATRTYLISDLVRMQSERFGLPLPSFSNEDRIYDNGDVAVFRLRPQTPYQK